METHHFSHSPTFNYGRFKSPTTQSHRFLVARRLEWLSMDYCPPLYAVRTLTTPDSFWPRLNGLLGRHSYVHNYVLTDAAALKLPGRHLCQRGAEQLP
jgi:hypothetical protein